MVIRQGEHFLDFRDDSLVGVGCLGDRWEVVHNPVSSITLLAIAQLINGFLRYVAGPEGKRDARSDLQAFGGIGIPPAEHVEAVA